ncbi:MAG: hypothetical protein KAH06_02900 [Desulfobacterales bacterium]|nr:hypothetical protein [Desulfobacterales bacterium]
MVRFLKNFMKSGIRDDSGKSKMQFTAHKWYAAGLMVIWTCLVIGSLTWNIYHQHAHQIWMVHGFLWLIGLSGIIFGVRRLSKSEQNRKFAERSLKKSFGQFEEKVEERTAALSAVNRKLQKEVVEREQAEVELKKHRDHLEELVEERTQELETKNTELESMNRLFVGREFRIKELKEKFKGQT